MKILLDTNAFIRIFAEPGGLPSVVKSLIPDNDLCISIATPWEMIIKESLGKLRLSEPALFIVQEHLRRRAVEILPITFHHLESLRNLPHHHKDPFDRIIIAQALTERIPVISSDAVFDGYGVQRMWE